MFCKVPWSLSTCANASLQLFKAISVNALAISMSFVQDLKLGHYMKIPPRVTFMGESLRSRPVRGRAANAAPASKCN